MRSPLAGTGWAPPSGGRDVGCPYHAALALADADDEGALRQALGELQALGARPAAAIVTRRLREPRGTAHSARAHGRERRRTRPA